MKLSLLFSITLVACSSTTNAVAPAKPDAGARADVAAQIDAAVSYESTILATPWTLLANAPSVTGGAKQDDIFFTSNTLGYAVSGPASAIYKTTDGGDTWTTLLTKSGTYFRSILFTDDDHGFASNLGPLMGSSITDTNVMYATTNGGAAWNPVTTITGPMPTGICNQTAIDAQHLVAVGRVEGPSYFMQSSDSGATWASTDLTSEFQMLIDAHFFSPMEGIVVGGSAETPMKCTILRTIDGGQTFSPVFTSATSQSLCWKISFPSPSVGYVSVQDTAGGNGSFAKTIDGGKTWTENPLPTKGYAGIGVGFITESIGWISSEDATQPTYRTSDGGDTWTADAVLKSPINRFRFVDKATAYAIGGSIWKLTLPVSP